MLAEDGIQEDNEEPESIPDRIKNIEAKGNFVSSKRHFKKLVLDLGIIIFEFTFLMAIMEGYFILNYLLSSSFLSQVSSLTSELKALISRLPSNNLLLLSEL